MDGTVMVSRFLMNWAKEVTDMTETNSGKQQDSVEFFHSLFEQMRHGFALHEILCDSQGNPVDYRFLYVNPAFESITGLHSADLQNRTVREIMPENRNKIFAATAFRIGFFMRYSHGNAPCEDCKFSQDW